MNGASIGLEPVATSILKVDYSAVSHSCIAEVETQSHGLDEFSVVDIVTKEIYGGRICNEGDGCNKLIDEIHKKNDDLYVRAIAGSIKPLGRR